MPYSRLFLLVEGDDDLRFLEHVITPALSSSYDFVQAWKYAQQKPEKVNRFLRSIKSMGADYFLLGDLNACECFPKKREALAAAFTNLDGSKAIIVVREIEGWYLAGLTADNSLGVQVPASTTDLTKEQFDQIIPRQFDSRIDYMIEVLKNFDIATASKRNASFHYFAHRVGLLRS